MLCFKKLNIIFSLRLNLFRKNPQAPSTWSSNLKPSAPVTILSPMNFKTLLILSAALVSQTIQASFFQGGESFPLKKYIERELGEARQVIESPFLSVEDKYAYLVSQDPLKLTLNNVPIELFLWGTKNNDNLTGFCDAFKKRAESELSWIAKHRDADETLFVDLIYQMAISKCPKLTVLPAFEKRVNALYEKASRLAMAPTESSLHMQELERLGTEFRELHNWEGEILAEKMIKTYSQFLAGAFVLPKVVDDDLERNKWMAIAEFLA